MLDAKLLALVPLSTVTSLTVKPTTGSLKAKVAVKLSIPFVLLSVSVSIVRIGPVLSVSICAFVVPILALPAASCATALAIDTLIVPPVGCIQTV